MHNLQIEIDNGSGFCFGVTTAIKKAEEELAMGNKLYCLGDIVHNGMECERLERMGLVTIDHDEMARLHNVKVLLRAHGEPPETYEMARRNNIEIIDATCPVVLKLQKRIKEQWSILPQPTTFHQPPQIVIFGKKGHAEVLGLVGQTQGNAIVIESFDEVKQLDMTKDIYLYSQTTKSLDEFHRIIDYIQSHIAPTATFRSFDTICRSVANRMPNISQFAARHDLILFVCGRKSSNGKVLFNECLRVNSNSHLVEGPEEIDHTWLEGISTVGICGATSTPKWLMEQCYDAVIQNTKSTQNTQSASPSPIRRLLTLLVLVLSATIAFAGRPQLAKLSPMLRQLVRQQTVTTAGSRKAMTQPRDVCAFIKISSDGDEVLQQNGCRKLEQLGDIYIANIPSDRLTALTLDRRVVRIEAQSALRHANDGSNGRQVLMDSVALHINAWPIYDAIGVPQAYTGSGVVMGVMDIGFDLTHPNFYNREATEYRIERFWDMLSADTIGSQLYVGRDYSGRDELLALGCARDGNDQSHGTHTLGIAAGSGYDTNYRGMAPESDICIVANATSDDIELIDSADYYKYTFATDALGFKYMFDYATSVGKPCVASFSEGSVQDFWGYDQLFYEYIDRLVGPGRIIVVAAGNQGRVKSWFQKPVGTASAGTFLRSDGSEMITTYKSDGDFTLRFVSYTAPSDTLLLPMNTVTAGEDSTLTVRLGRLEITAEAYPSCYNDAETCYDITVSDTLKQPIGYMPRLSVEIVGTETHVEAFRVNGTFAVYDLNPELNSGECTHNILSPGSAQSVICVGNNMYRQGVTNYLGEWKEYEHGGNGLINSSSSVGPTFDGRIKPDVVAPGVNIISSYSSFYLEHHPDANDIKWDVKHFPFRGRTYAWNSNSGTSMSCPAVAGVIALWLQACPTLTPDDVFGVIQRTSRHVEPELEYPNNSYGYGEIDAYAGLLDILGLSEIKEVSHRHTRATVGIKGGQLLITLPETSTRAFTVSMYDLAGRPIINAKLPAGSVEYSVALPHHPGSGVYAVCLGPTSPAPGSTVISPEP